MEERVNTFPELDSLGLDDVIVVLVESGPPKLLDRVRTAVRMRHCSPRTEEAYVHWIRRYAVFHGKRHPGELGQAEVTAFLSSLARRGVNASTQNQALSAVLFLSEVVIGERPAWTRSWYARTGRADCRWCCRATKWRVCSVTRTARRVMASLMYGTGLRLMECVELRVKDAHLDRGGLTVRDGKGESRPMPS